MVHDLQVFVAANLIEVAAAGGAIAMLAAAAVRYGRRHEARTRARGTRI